MLPFQHHTFSPSHLRGKLDNAVRLRNETPMPSLTALATRAKVYSTRESLYLLIQRPFRPWYHTSSDLSPSQGADNPIWRHCSLPLCSTSGLGGTPPEGTGVDNIPSRHKVLLACRIIASLSAVVLALERLPEANQALGHGHWTGEEHVMVSPLAVVMVPE